MKGTAGIQVSDPGSNHCTKLRAFPRNELIDLAACNVIVIDEDGCYFCMCNFNVLSQAHDRTDTRQSCYTNLTVLFAAGICGAWCQSVMLRNARSPQVTTSFHRLPLPALRARPGECHLLSSPQYHLAVSLTIWISSQSLNF